MHKHTCLARCRSSTSLILYVSRSILLYGHETEQKNRKERKSEKERIGKKKTKVDSTGAERERRSEFCFLSELVAVSCFIYRAGSIINSSDDAWWCCCFYFKLLSLSLASHSIMDREIKSHNYICVRNWVSARNFQFSLVNQLENFSIFVSH
jgi:hypothetical protein